MATAKTAPAPKEGAKTAPAPKEGAKTTKAPQDEAARNAALAKAREARESASKKDRFVFLKDNPEAKLAPQAKCIIEIVKSHGKDGVSRENLEAEMATGLKDGAHKVVTRQPQGRILSYYVKLITAETGILRIDKAAAPEVVQKQAA